MKRCAACASRSSSATTSRLSIERRRLFHPAKLHPHLGNARTVEGVRVALEPDVLGLRTFTDGEDHSADAVGPVEHHRPVDVTNLYRAEETNSGPRLRSDH